MLEHVNLAKRLGKSEYKAALPALQRRLYELERACWHNQVSSVVVFEGWDAAGKGGAISTLTERLDPRGFKLYPVVPPRTWEQQYPWLRRFWLCVPNHGEMVIFDHSWYSRLLNERVEGLVEESEWSKAFQDIVEFERMLSDDGTVLLKFWFHIGKKEQRRRFAKIGRDPLEAWRITKEDLARHRKYDQYVLAVEEMLERTESEFAPWTIVEATSRWHARRKTFETIIAALERRLGELAPPPAGKAEEAARDAELRAAADALAGPDDGAGNGEE
jgi:polyphosphate kinase 2 (PPK2 family)